MKIFKNKKYTILSTIFKYSFVFIIAFSILMPVMFVGAAGGTVPGNSGTVPSSSGTNITTGITNPLGNNINDIPTFIEAILNIVLVIGVPIVTLAIIYSGFLFVTAQGNAEKLGAAKKTLMFTLVGAALLLGSFVIANAIKGTVEEIKRTT
jgi:hypothetical protein